MALSWAKPRSSDPEPPEFRFEAMLDFAIDCERELALWSRFQRNYTYWLDNMQGAFWCALEMEAELHGKVVQVRDHNEHMLCWLFSMEQKQCDAHMKTRRESWQNEIGE